MKLLAILLSISCIFDIFFPFKKVLIAYNNAKKNQCEMKNIKLVQFIRSEVLNIMALVFFMIFIIKY